ncbi:RNA polymerase sigma factor [Cecembia calidifontis]|jgi:RNA polymerase sigma-70 factor (ECF subfamily)|uniref:RNA polymerase sigma-70 factor (ECF subfamily) n=1 Tax=Cecembia calidifontis TaxID=1187080 RepID=A0A4Q7P982_9BACT|nr:sigma-70 family RNA polymerase sigma factor [Cecembia calidifontis]RZS96763.1 RNA polymerase sigma-70 factor (ECF subfamily) [Cecembia calidifontis]
MLFRKTFTTEQEIIKACLKNDRKAQEQLYQTYSRKFLAICIRYVKDRELAEDVLMEGFMKIFEKLPQFESKGSFEGWMKRIIVTQSLLTLRNSRHLNMEVVQVETHLEVQENSYELNHLEAADLMELIQELPVGYRTVFNLYAVEGYSHSEIGDLLGITESTSKSQLNRARNLLKQKIADIQTKERRING